jgi:hypothetical protein
LNKDWNLDSTWVFSEQQLWSFLDIELKWPNSQKILKNLLILWWVQNNITPLTLSTLSDIAETNIDFYPTLIKNLTEKSFLAPLDTILINWNEWIHEYMMEDIRIQTKWLQTLWKLKTDIDELVQEKVSKLLLTLPEDARYELVNNPIAYKKFTDRISSISIWIVTWDNRWVWISTTVDLNDVVWGIIDSMTVWVWVVDWVAWLVLSFNKSFELTEKLKLSSSVWVANFVMPFVYLWMTYSTDKYYDLSWWVTLFEWW